MRILSSTLLAEKLQINLGAEARSQALPYASSTKNAFGLWLGNILRIVMIVSVLLVLFFLITGAIDYISAGGEKGKLESARNKITGAIIGLIVLAAALAIFFLVQNFTGVNIIKLATGIIGLA